MVLSLAAIVDVMEDNISDKIDSIIKKDFKELFGDDTEASAPVARQSTSSPAGSDTALPSALYEIMENLTGVVVDNPYCKLITAIEHIL